MYQSSKGLPVLLFFLFVPSVLGQALFVRTLGGGSNDLCEGAGMVYRMGRGWIVAGHTASFGAGNLDLLLVEFDSAGNHQWSRTLGGSGEDKALSLTQTTDGGYATGGFTRSFGAGGADALLVKFDSLGNHDWVRTLGGSAGDEGYSLAYTRDGGYAVAGFTESFGAGGRDALLAKFDSSGSHQWTRTLGGGYEDWATSIAATADGGCAITGITTSFGAGDRDAFLAKFDSSGNHEWTRTLGGSGIDCGFSVIQRTDGGFGLVGWTTSYGAGDRDLLLAQFGSSGGFQWAKVLGGSGEEKAISTVETADGGYAIAGWTTSFGAGNYDAFVVKFDSSGNHEWTRTLGGTGRDLGYSIVQTADKDYGTAGYAASFGAGGYDLLFAKLDSLGHSCLGDTVSPSVVAVTPAIDSIAPSVGHISPTIGEPNPLVTIPDPTITTVCESDGPAILACSLRATPDTVSIGQSVYVSMRVQNIGRGDADSVVPQIGMIGEGVAVLDSGPSPAYMDIQSGSDTVFSWVYSAQNNGWMNWRGYAIGFCQMLQQEVQSPEDTSNPLLIQTEAQVEVLIVIADADTVRRGDEDVSIDVVLDNNGEADALVDSMNLRFVTDSENLDDEYVTTWLDPIGVLPALTADILHFEGDVTSGATVGWVYVHSRIFGRDRNSGEILMDTTAALPDSFFVVEGYRCGDCNGDERISMADASYIVSYIYRDGASPIGEADVNVDARISVADANYLVSYIYRDGSEPCNPPTRHTRSWRDLGDE